MILRTTMKIIPLHWRGARVGCPQPEGPTPKATPCAPPERGFSREHPSPHDVTFNVTLNKRDGTGVLLKVLRNQSYAGSGHEMPGCDEHVLLC